MRRTKLVIVVDAEIEETTDAQVLADVYRQALGTVDETIVHDFVLYEHDKEEVTFNELMDVLKFDFQYGDFRHFE